MMALVRRGHRTKAAIVLTCAAVVVFAIWLSSGRTADKTTRAVPSAARTSSGTIGFPPLGATPAAGPTDGGALAATTQADIRAIGERGDATTVETAVAGAPDSGAVCGRLWSRPGQPPQRFVWIAPARLLAKDDGGSAFATLTDRACPATVY